MSRTISYKRGNGILNFNPKVLQKIFPQIDAIDWEDELYKSIEKELIDLVICDL